MENENLDVVDFDDVDVSDVVTETAEESKENETVEQTTEVEEVKEEETKEQPIPEFDFEITYNGNKEKLTKEEAITLAQKGKDYDKIRPVYDFVKELAEDEGKSVTDYIKTTSDNLKDYKIKQLAEEKGISEEVAAELYESRVAQKKSLASEKELKERNEAEEKKNAEFQEFINTYPNVKAEEIPATVWEKVNKGTPLKFAYMEHEFEQLKNENTILKNNAKNKEQEITTGEQVNSKPKDIFEEAWDNA